jgi:hypothetical protein
MAGVNEIHFPQGAFSMSEQLLQQPERRQDSGPSGLDDFSDIGGPVTVSHGVHTESLPAGNMTVGEIRRRFTDRFDIDPHSQAEVDGRVVGDETLIRPGQMLMFRRDAGEKGAGKKWKVESEKLKAKNQSGA